jgi:tRNA-Thr(GGU) m(6)t(6)A37 methyltransferase TsaA
MQSDSAQIKPIGVIHSPFDQAGSAPIQPVFARGAEGTVEVLPAYADALADLEGFERIWLLYWFDRAAPFKPRVTPYLDDRKRGLFATRAPSRPNPIGMSCVRLLSVEGSTIRVGDIDVLDNTPLLDIKPYAKRFDSFDVSRQGWLDAAADKQGESDSRFYRNAKDKES